MTQHARLKESLERRRSWASDHLDKARAGKFVAILAATCGASAIFNLGETAAKDMVPGLVALGLVH